MVLGYTESRIIEIEDNGEASKVFRIKYKSKTFPGQYLMVWSKGFGELSVPITYSNQDYIDISINKRTKASAKLFTLTKKDTIFLRGPYGHGIPMNNLKQKDIVLIGQNSLFSPLSFVQRFVKEQIEDYMCITTIILQDETDEFIERTRKQKEKEDSKVFVLKDIEDIKKIILEQNKKTEYILSLDNPRTLEILKTLEKQEISPKQIYFYLHRKISCGQGICGSCASFGVHTCIEGPVFRADKLKRVFHG